MADLDWTTRQEIITYESLKHSAVLDAAGINQMHSRFLSLERKAKMNRDLAWAAAVNKCQHISSIYASIASQIEEHLK
jgi:hypothetical protein